MSDRSQRDRPVGRPESVWGGAGEMQVVGNGILEDELHMLRRRLVNSNRSYTDLSADYDSLVATLEILRSSVPPSPASVPEEQAGGSDYAGNIEEELAEIEKKLEEARRKEVEIKKELLLDTEASHEEVMDKIAEYRKGKRIAEKQVGELEKRYENMKQEKIKLHTDLKKLYNEQDKKEARQRHKQRMQAEKLRSGLSTPVCNITLETLPKIRQVNSGWTSSRQPSNIRPSRQARAQQPQQSEAQQPYTGPGQRCVLCRDDFPTDPSLVDDTRYCHIHYHTFKNGVWRCCGGNANTRGCIRVPHVRVELTRDTVSLTDGNNSMEL